MTAVTIYDYLPPAASLVRFRAEEYCGAGKTTRLVRVEDLSKAVARTPRAKISVSYAALQGGQCSEHVVKVNSVCVDLDGIASIQSVKALQERFPGAAVVFGNGVTLLYKIPSGMSWASAAIVAFQIGKEGERLTALTLDVGTLLRADGTPAQHSNHLFRFPAGWAAKRNAAVDFYSPLSPNSLIADAAGLSHPLPSRAGDCSPANGKASTSSSQTKSSGGSQEAELQACSLALRIRRQVLASGGSIFDAVTQASCATGKSQKVIAAMFSRPGYEPRCFASPATGQLRPIIDNQDVGVIGLESSSRRFQRSRTMPANFGHSLQGFWDAKRGPDVAYGAALFFPEFEKFRKWFQDKFGSDWQEAMREDVQRCWGKFGERRALQLVSKRCLEEIRSSLVYGGRSAPAIVEISGFSIRQVKRALKEMLARNEVTFTGKTKAKVWLINPCHTEELLGGVEGDGVAVTPRIDLQPLTRGHSFDGVPILWSRDWTKPKGCPPNTGEPPRHEDDGRVNPRETGSVDLNFETADHSGVASSSIHSGNRCGTRQWSPATISAEPSRTSLSSTVWASVAGSTSRGRVKSARRSGTEAESRSSRASSAFWPGSRTINLSALFT